MYKWIKYLLELEQYLILILITPNKFVFMDTEDPVREAI
jgi:hypothetical protein